MKVTPMLLGIALGNLAFLCFAHYPHMMRPWIALIAVVGLLIDHFVELDRANKHATKNDL